MSNTQYIFLKRSAVPDRERLQAALDELGLPLALDPEFTPFTDLGYSPCKLPGGIEAGFEIFYEDAEEILSDDEELRESVGDRDYCISLVWRSSDADLACVMAASAAYAKKFGAVVSYECEEPAVPHALLKEARELIANLGKVEQSQVPPASPSVDQPEVEITITGLIGGKVVSKKYKRSDPS